MVKGRKKKKEPVADEEERPVHLRGEEYEVDKLTGKRATKGKLPGGAPKCVQPEPLLLCTPVSLTHIVPFACRWVYEVKWRPSDGKTWPNSYEPASCLAPMKRLRPRA